MPEHQWKHPKNKGWTGVEYNFGVEPELNKKLGETLNEACHVFYYHGDGNWITTYKDQYARLIAEEFRARPSLIKKLLGTEDRVVKMVAYRAIELNEGRGDGELLAGRDLAS